MTALYESRELATQVSDKLKVYAQPQRLMILSCLLRGELNVAEIGDATGIAQPALSQQLAELRRADLVNTRKEAKQVWYALADESVRTCVESMEGVFGNGETDKLPAQAKRPVVAPPQAVIGAARFARLV